MIKLLGVALIVVGIVFGIYMGCSTFINGIVQIVEAIKATPVEAHGIAFGILKIVFAVTIGWLSAAIPLLIGYVLACQ